MKTDKLQTPKTCPNRGTYREKISERPDNGSKSSVYLGPSSDHRRDNPHQQAKHTPHAS